MTEHSGDYQPVDKHVAVSGPVLWFGGKGHLAGWIADHLPEHDTYVEPYGGAAAVLFTKRPAPIEVYNDLHGDLVNLMRVLRSDEADRLHVEASCILHARAEYEHAVDVLNSDEADPYRRALAFFVGMNQGFGGTYPTLGRWAKSKGQRLSGGMGNNTAQWWRKVSFIGDWHERLASVQVENRPAIDVMRDYDSPTTTHYVDPPYPSGTRTRSLNAYKHEATDADHRDLVKYLLEVEGAVVLSGYDTDLYSPLAEAGWRMVTRAAHARGAGEGGDKKRVECLWMNREPADHFGRRPDDG